MRLAPRAESRRAISRPMPWEDPVRSTVWQNSVFHRFDGQLNAYLALDWEPIALPESESHDVGADPSNKDQQKHRGPQK